MQIKDVDPGNGAASKSKKWKYALNNNSLFKMCLHLEKSHTFPISIKLSLSHNDSVQNSPDQRPMPLNTDQNSVIEPKYFSILINSDQRWSLLLNAS